MSYPRAAGKHLDMAAPGRFAALKLLGHETNESIMLFEETVPGGTKSLFHLHRDSDEVAWVLAGRDHLQDRRRCFRRRARHLRVLPAQRPACLEEHRQRNRRVLFLYTPAAAGGYVEELLNRPEPNNDDADSANGSTVRAT